ncbi:hypothetical protein GQ607_011217 [Colletotrichum asianum]|uniref:Uncharacterized protein n=1 Tax=Colletotrichum asianum TaxID=702518 RepID=A0A8H3ZN27_9PEZI|nr:hypothetical protein GQ607_011217 [Colletotrichum asianum]
MCCCPMWQACLAAAQASMSRAPWHIPSPISHLPSPISRLPLPLPPRPRTRPPTGQAFMGSPTLVFPFWSFGLIWPCSPYSYATLPFPALMTLDWALLAAVACAGSPVCSRILPHLKAGAANAESLNIIFAPSALSS